MTQETLSTISLEETAAIIRRNIFRMAYHAGGGHIAPSFSIADILTVLYFDVLNVDPTNIQHPDRDRFILSKGHASAALFATLAERSFFEKSILKTYSQPGSLIGGHPERGFVPGVEASTGALGHGLSFANGIAYAAKMGAKKFQTFVVMGDGECQEGSIWEAALFAAHHGLDNLTVILDYNKLQAIDTVDAILKLEPFAEKWKAFGWEVREVDGHDLEVLTNTLHEIPFCEGKPNLILAHTVKGKGISFMEDVPIWHYRMPKGEELNQACEELGIHDLEEFE